MYQGYRLKINNAEIPNSIIARGTYQIDTEDRIAEQYTDAYGVDHIRMFAKTKTVITFSVREHNSAEHQIISSYFSKRANVSVEFYDDDTDTYKSGLFRIIKNPYSHKNTYGRNIQYNATQIKLEEY